MVDVIVVGGGPAGVTAALRARELGARVTLVERGGLGGTATNDGVAPTRVLARAARLAREARHFEQFGLSGGCSVVDFRQLMESTQKIVYRLHEKKQLINHLENVGINLRQEVGEAHFIDPQTLELGNGEQLRADKFILCAGGHARRVSFPGSEYTLTHSDIWDLDHLPASIAIVGGAATGCQLASIFSAFGSQVTLLEMGPYLLGREDEVIGRSVTESFLRRGIQIITGISGVERIDPDGSGLVLTYLHHDQPQKLGAEAIIMAVGWPGNVESLNLEAAGVKAERGYVWVDDYFRTSVDHIYAAGDITGRMMLVQSAGYEARIAAENAVLGPGLRYKHQIVPHGGFTDPEYGSVGLTEEQAKKLEGGYLASTVSYAEMDRALIDGYTDGYCKLLVSQENHRIVGAHVVGEQALEIVHIVAAAMAADMWVEQLAELEIAYPTYTGIVGLAARRLMRDLGVMPLSTEWQSLGKPLASEWERKDA
jgi:dihydrolipoamide dehydrogenase